MSAAASALATVQATVQEDQIKTATAATVAAEATKTIEMPTRPGEKKVEKVRKQVEVTKDHTSEEVLKFLLDGYDLLVSNVTIELCTPEQQADLDAERQEERDYWDEQIRVAEQEEDAEEAKSH